MIFGHPCPHKCGAKIVRAVGDLDQDEQLELRCDKGHHAVAKRDKNGHLRVSKGS